MLKMIAKGITVMRLGDPSSVKLELREYTLEELLKQKKRTSKGNQKKLMKQLFQEVDVICTTCVKSGSELLKNMEFSHVIIDEVSQAIGETLFVFTYSLEPSTLIPLMKGCKQAVLIGSLCLRTP